jgi:hypothetical protein
MGRKASCGTRGLSGSRDLLIRKNLNLMRIAVSREETCDIQQFFH